MTRSFIKIYGPPILKAIRALEKIAVDMSQKTTIRFYSGLVSAPPYPYEYDDNLMDEYLSSLLPETDLSGSEKVKLISRSSDTLGDYDFFFEWGEEPKKEQVLELIEMIDEALAECGCKYTITTK